MWKKVTIKHCENYYVSDKGEIINSKNGKELKGWCNQNGYQRIRLRANKKNYDHYVHRIVALAFIENLEGRLEVHHIDKDRSNNNMNNLMWVTHKENMAFVWNDDDPEFFKPIEIDEDNPPF